MDEITPKAPLSPFLLCYACHVLDECWTISQILVRISTLDPKWLENKVQKPRRFPLISLSPM